MYEFLSVYRTFRFFFLTRNIAVHVYFYFIQAIVYAKLICTRGHGVINFKPVPMSWKFLENLNYPVHYLYQWIVLDVVLVLTVLQIIMDLRRWTFGRTQCTHLNGRKNTWVLYHVPTSICCVLWLLSLMVLLGSLLRLSVTCVLEKCLVLAWSFLWSCYAHSLAP